MKPQELTTIQIPSKIHKQLKRRAIKERSKLMPYASKIITKGIAAADAESKSESTD